jgi:hypothetical protein
MGFLGHEVLRFLGYKVALLFLITSKPHDLITSQPLTSHLSPLNFIFLQTFSILAANVWKKRFTGANFAALAVYKMKLRGLIFNVIDLTKNAYICKAVCINSLYLHFF